MREGFNVCHNILEQVGVIVAFDPLDNRCQSLKTHSRVNIGFGQWRKSAVRTSVKLCENQIPDLQVTVTIAPGCAARLAASYRLSLVDVNFRTGATRSGVPHGPEIVFFTQPYDPIRGQANFFLPNIVGFIIILKYGDMQFIAGEVKAFRQQLPAPLNGFFFEVIPEREISQHFEKCVMPRGVPDVFQIVVLSPGAHAFLGRGCPRITGILS